MKSGQISTTAAYIAIKFYGLTRGQKFCALFDEDVILFYTHLVQALPYPAKLYHKLLKISSVRRFFVFWEELLLPGDLMHVLMRKWYLQKMITEMHQQGYRQLLVIGAGFDHLAAINSKKGVTAVELDAPQTMAAKRKFINQQQYQNSRLQLFKAFLSRDSLQQVLQTKSRLNPAKKTMVVAEGFFDYLNDAQASAILREVTSYFTGPLILFSTIFSLQELSRAHSFVYNKSIKLAGEKLKLHMNKQQYCQFLKQHGFTVEELISYHQMEQDILEPRGISMPVLRGFYLLKAPFHSNE